jgi:D-3-phosphoglycerate dehydrogenase
LVASADVISLHVPETQNTQNLINRELLTQFKKGSILINYARGQVVDLNALSESLKKGDLGGAAIDVFPTEPEKSGDTFTNPLQNLPNVLLTPHIGGSTEEAQQNIGEDVSNKLFHFLEKGVTNGSHTVPSLALPAQEGTHRILHIHKNVPGVLSDINTRLSKMISILLPNTLKQMTKLGTLYLM